MYNDLIEPISNAVGKKFTTFGNGQTSKFNPLANALADDPYQFALGVNVRDVVEFVIAEITRETDTSSEISAGEVKAIRKYLEFTQKELGDKLGTSQVTVARWETNARKCRGEYARKLFNLARQEQNRRKICTQNTIPT